MGMFIDGLKTHNLRLMDSAGVEVVFVRGNIRVTLTATIGSTDWQEQASGDVYQSLKSVDFIVDPAALKIGENLAEPSRGDLIEYQGENYYLVQTSNGAFWSWSDGFKTFYRIHTSKG